MLSSIELVMLEHRWQMLGSKSQVGQAGSGCGKIMVCLAKISPAVVKINFCRSGINGKTGTHSLLFFFAYGVSG
jgi:hypothetical protein